VTAGPFKWALAATATGVALASVAHATPRDVTSKAAMNRATLAMLRVCGAAINEG
jgi:hypothetical protein